MPVRNRHRVGRHLIVDDESGIVAYDDQIMKRWDGALVRKKGWETRHPQEFVRARNDPKALKDIRPAVPSTAAGLGPPFFVGNTQVPLKQGIGYRLTQQGIPTMRIGDDFIIQGEVDDISVTAQPLRYDPDVVLPLTNPNTYNITTATTATRTVALTSGEHAIIQLGSGRSTIFGQVLIIAQPSTDNRPRFHIRNGGHILHDGGTSQIGGNHTAFAISNCDGYVEGVRVDKGSSIGDALTFRGSGAAAGNLWVQNSLLLGGKTSAAGVHGDCFQIPQQVNGVHFYNVTMRGYSHGYLTNSNLNDQYVSGAAIVSGASFEKVNFILRPRADNAPYTADTNHLLFLQDDCSMKKIRYTLSEVYVKDQETGGFTKPGPLCRPGPQGTAFAAAACGSIETWDTCFWEPSSLITGEVRYGLPPGGNFVPLTFTGTNYQSPGYRST